MQNSVITQRLIGAIVVVSLAVIFIPMFLGGERDLEGIIHRSNVPDAPVYEFQLQPPADKSTLKDEVDTVLSSKIVEADVDVAADSLQAAPPAQKAPAAVAESAPSPQQAAEKAAAVAAVKPPVAKAPAKSMAKSPENKQAPAAADVKQLKQNRDKIIQARSSQSHLPTWAVQVASFSEKSRALALRDKLRASNYLAYVESVDLSSKIAYRVRVGPQAARPDAEEIQKKLKNQMKLDGIVVQR